MNIAVLIKQVPDSDEVKMDREKGTMIRDGVENIVNPLDLNALEAALALRSQHDGSITVMTMGPANADIALREALALGADEAVLLSDRMFAGADSWATALVLAKALQILGPFDLILAGEKATDGETGQVGPEVATIMDIPFSTYVSQLCIETASVRVRRTTEDGFQQQRLKLPCLLTVLNDINTPGMPTLNGKKRARRTNIKILGAHELDLNREEVGLAGSPTRVIKIDTPRIARETQFFSGKQIDEGLDRVVWTLKSLALI